MESPGTLEAPACAPIAPTNGMTAAGTVEYADFGAGPVVVALHGGLGGWDQGLILAQCAVPAGYRVLALSRAIADPAARQRLVDNPEVMALYTALLASTFHRMAERIAGTANDIRITKTTEPPLEQFRVPTLVVHGTADRVVPYARHVPAFAARLPGVRVCTVEGGDHVSLFTHRDLVRSEVGAFLEVYAAPGGRGRGRTTRRPGH
ncbi:MAG: alpha/beta hydrolase [Opitutaceae bacterium]|nr:alpha/beta hydrolase [Opitutaceae bacterium]